VKAEERKRKLAAEETPLGERAARFEAETKIKWNDSWTNVPDDGNCLLHAFWLGLSTLLQFYPHLKLADEQPLAKTPVAFREQLFAKLKADPDYRSTLKTQLSLYVESIEEAFLISMDDFYVLPEALRKTILDLKARLYSNAGPVEIDYGAMVNQYVQAMCESKRVGDRTVYMPLGQTELTALCRVYRARLQTIDTDTLFKSLGAVTVDECDPRLVLSRDVHEFDRTQSRYVRLLNIKGNHYNVHLPVSPDRDSPRAVSDATAAAASATKTQFNDGSFWGTDASHSYGFISADRLPPL